MKNLVGLLLAVVLAAGAATLGHPTIRVRRRRSCQTTRALLTSGAWRFLPVCSAPLFLTPTDRRLPMSVSKMSPW